MYCIVLYVFKHWLFRTVSTQYIIICCRTELVNFLQRSVFSHQFVFNGYRTTNNWQIAFNERECSVDPLILIRDNCDIGNFVIERCTSSALVKVLSESKKLDLLKRLAVSIHVFNHIANTLLRGIKPGAPAKEVSLDTVKKALTFLDYCLAQKEVIVEVSESMTKVIVVIVIVVVVVWLLENPSLQFPWG
jgi:hypothetical protein